MKDGRFQPSRRRLLTGGAAAAASLLLAGCDQLSRAAWVQKTLGAAQDWSLSAQRLLAGRSGLAPEFPAADISPQFRANGSANPHDPAYKKSAANGFADWQIPVTGLVNNPLNLYLADLKAFPARTQITRHDCVEGWSVIGQWTGAVFGHVLDQAQPQENARYVVFHCADKLGGRDPYYESIDMVTAYHPQTLLAYGLNGRSLPVANGAPLRLRAERQLGYKMAKYIKHIEVVDSFAHIQGGQGGYWEDRGYNWYAGI